MRFFVALALFCASALSGCGGTPSAPIDESADSAVEMSDDEAAGERAIENGAGESGSSGNSTDI